MNDNTIDNPKPFYLHQRFRKVLILAVFSVVGIVVVFVLLSQMTTTAEEIKKIKQESASEEDMANYAFLESEIVHYQEEIDELNSLFASDSEIIIFVQEIDRLKREGVVQSFSFVSNDAIKDKSGNAGIPISIVMKGNEEQLDAALRNIQSLPFLLRAVQTEISKEVNDEGIEETILNYGGFLYVEEPETN